MSWFKTKAPRLTREQYNTLDNFVQEQKVAKRDAYHAQKLAGMKLKQAQHKIEIANERLDAAFAQEKEWATQWIPHLAAAFITTEVEDALSLDPEGRENIADEAVLMAAALVISWRELETQLNANHNRSLNTGENEDESD